MNKKNPDGSIDVLGAEEWVLRPGLIVGNKSKKGLQRSLAEHADVLRAAGATIVKQTKNSLVARYGNETGYYLISDRRISPCRD